MMPIFKYYRANHYFEKALRYDEVYFSSNAELNDPLDLTIKYYFSDNERRWKKILQSKPSSPNLDLTHFIGLDCDKLACDLNLYFKNINIESNKTIKMFIDTRSVDIENIFKKHIINTNNMEIKINSPFIKMDVENKAKFCVQILIELLSRGWSKRYYSCSFSRNPLEPKMWAHYADGFRGCVLIYSTQEETSIKLKQNLLLRNYETFYFSKVNYDNKEKLTDILECIENGEELQSNLLNKSHFWSYEEESRILLSEDFSSIRVSTSKEMPHSNKSRIFHHSPDSVKGVIFGANSSELFKEHVTSMLAEKFSYLYEPLSICFYTFDTELTINGCVNIRSGSECRHTTIGTSQVMKRDLNGENLDKILQNLCITDQSGITQES